MKVYLTHLRNLLKNGYYKKHVVMAGPMGGHFKTYCIRQGKFVVT